MNDRPSTRDAHERADYYVGVGLALGAGVGTAIGAVLGDTGMGLALGAGIGVAAGAAMGEAMTARGSERRDV